MKRHSRVEFAVALGVSMAAHGLAVAIAVALLSQDRPPLDSAVSLSVAQITIAAGEGRIDPKQVEKSSAEAMAPSSRVSWPKVIGPKVCEPDFSSPSIPTLPRVSFSVKCAELPLDSNLLKYIEHSTGDRPPIQPMGTDPVADGDRPREQGTDPGAGGGQATVVVSAHAAEAIRPTYPIGARRRGEEGEVVLLVTVGESGAVENVKVEVSSGYGDLDEAALAAVRTAPFVPAESGGHPIASTVRLMLRFQLSK